jgi:uncharacterized repeat protein (TIGR03803 family)
MSKLHLWRTICLVSVFCALAVIASPADTFTALIDFDGTNGQNPYFMSLVQGFDGNLYGTTEGVPSGDVGTVFKITTGGELTTLCRFDGTDGANPYAGLVQATDGDFYGTTYGYGHGYGTVFKITTGGELTTLHNFDYRDGAYPSAPLVQATDGNFYGTTIRGGKNSDGTVFKITAGRTLTTLHSFDGTDGSDPYAGLVQATDGNFYGTTNKGGENRYGTVFKITAGGTLTALYNFCSKPNCTDGASSYAGLVQATDGNFYGTTAGGGTGSDCSIDGGCGTVFKITAGGTLTTLYNFCSQTNCTDGLKPLGGLVQATDGNFYGTTWQGGPTSGGTVFSLGVGLGLFVKTEPTSGMVGADVIILGNNLTGATSVTFNGKAATFKVVSSTEITTTVPSSVTTGKLKLKTPSGTLTSNVNFRVS